MDLGYAYANARIKGMRSNLLDENAFRELMQVKTLDEVTALLEQTPYKQDLVEASKNHSGVQRIDIALHNNQARVIAKLAKILPAKGRALFAMLAAEWDAQNLKLIFSKKHLGQEIAREELIPTGKSFDRFYAKLITAKTAGEALEIAAAKWGSRKFKVAARELAKKNPDLKSVIAEIDAERARQLVLLAQNASDPLTRKIVEQQLAFENVMAALRLKKEGVKNAGKLVAYKNGAISRILHAQDFDEAVKQALLAYSLPPEQAAKAKESLSLLEIALERKTVNSILALTKMSVMSFATAIGFVYLKKVEVSNLRKIAYANAFGLKQELGQYVFAINA